MPITPGAPDAEVETARREQLHQAFAIKRQAKEKEARETLKQGIRKEANAPLRGILRRARVISVRERRMHEKAAAYQQQRLPANVFPKAAVYLPRDLRGSFSLLSGQKLVRPQYADVLVTRSIREPSWLAVFAMLHGKILAQGLSTKTPWVQYKPHPERSSDQCRGWYKGECR